MSHTRPLTRWLAFSLLALAGCGGGQDVTPRHLEAARARWEEAGIRDYDLEWTTSGAREGHYLVAVRDGQVRRVLQVLPDGREIVAHPGDPSFYGVEGLFRVLEEESEQLLEPEPFGQRKGTTILLKFEPDPELGYPAHFRRDVVGSARGLAIDVVRLQRNSDPVGTPASEER
jgi:hypothetical protein